MAEEKKEETGVRNVFPRFCVVPEGSLAMLNRRTEAEIMEAQEQVDESMINALEGLVRAARAGKIEGRSALALEAVAW